MLMLLLLLLIDPLLLLLLLIDPLLLLLLHENYDKSIEQSYHSTAVNNAKQSEATRKE